MGDSVKLGNGVMRSFISRLIASASPWISCKPTAVPLSAIPKNRVLPIPFENALTLFSQLFGFFISNATLKSHCVELLNESG